MGILIGMDEAGYGPHLGPLAVAATVWHVDDDALAPTARPAPVGLPASAGMRATKRKNPTRASANVTTATAVRSPKSAIRNPQSAIDLYRLLRKCVAKTTSELHVPIADSKVLYSPAAGLRHLERGLHAVLRSVGQTPVCWSEIVEYSEADADGHHKLACWPDGFDCRLPIDAEDDELTRLEARFTRTCESVGVRPLFIRARLVFPAQFNDLIDHYGNKATALSHITIGLLREVVDAIPALAPRSSQLAPTHAVCDKHGGRNFYTAILQHHFSEHWITPVFESHAESHYEWGEPGARTRVVFQVNGERFLPTALASMTAKYLRELSMRAFNEFWRTHIPELKPTAGYYRDAWRFKNEITAKQKELKIDDRVIWRSR
jgi:hypothetical protein